MADDTHLRMNGQHPNFTRAMARRYATEHGLLDRTPEERRAAHRRYRATMRRARQRERARALAFLADFRSPKERRGFWRWLMDVTVALVIIVVALAVIIGVVGNHGACALTACN